MRFVLCARRNLLGNSYAPRDRTLQADYEDLDSLKGSVSRVCSPIVRNFPITPQHIQTHLESQSSSVDASERRASGAPRTGVLLTFHYLVSSAIKVKF